MTAHYVSMLEAVRRRSLRMASEVEDMVQQACETITTNDKSLAREVIDRDVSIDAAEVEVEAEVISLLALYQPVGADLRLLCSILRVTADLERVADCAVNIAERARHLEVQPLARREADFGELCDAVIRALRSAVQTFRTNNSDAARTIIARDEAIDALYAQIVRSVVAEADRSPASLSAHLDLLSVAKNLERIADHATNIAEYVIFLSTGKIVRHQSAS